MPGSEVEGEVKMCLFPDFTSLTFQSGESWYIDGTGEIAISPPGKTTDRVMDLSELSKPACDRVCRLLHGGENAVGRKD